jgi:hypothetical protein
MKHLKVGLVLVLACFLGNTFATTLLSDNFHDSAATKTNWIFDAAVKHQFTGSALNVQNADTTYMWFITHSFSPASPTFTISLTIAPTQPSNGFGLFFCKKKNDGISLQVGTNQNLTVWKFDTTSVQMLYSVTNSFISKAANTISVSKRDSTFTLFCNGAYIGSFYCSIAKFINGGDVAMIVPPKGQAQLSSFIMTDQFQPGVTLTTFSDNFSSSGLVGWNFGSFNGGESVASGALTVTNNDLVYPVNPYVTGNFNQASLKVIATHKRGDGLYGLAFYDLAPGPLGDSLKPYLFLINSSRSYASGNPDTRLIYATQSSLVHGDKDTLEVLRFSNKYKFRINGALMDDSFPLLAPGRIDAAGLFVDTDAVVSFEDFRIGGDSTGFTTGVISSQPRMSHVASKAKFYGSDIAVFDLRGRMIKRSSGNYLESVKSLAGGMYIMRPIENKIVEPEKSMSILK